MVKFHSPVINTIFHLIRESVFVIIVPKHLVAGDEVQFSVKGRLCADDAYGVVWHLAQRVEVVSLNEAVRFHNFSLPPICLCVKLT